MPGLPRASAGGARTRWPRSAPRASEGLISRDGYKRGMEHPKLYVGSIVIDCDNFEKVATFWQAALGYLPRDPGADGWTVLKDPSGKGPNVSINRTSEGPLDQYRLHLDLYTEDRAGEVERLVRLGATVHHRPPPGHDFVEMADPEGHLFCVVQV